MAKAIHSEDQKLEVPSVGSSGSLIINSLDGPLAGAKWLSIRSSSFATEAAAILEAERLKDALLVVGVERRLGIDCGQNRKTGYLADSIKEKLNEQGVRIRDQVHGMDIFEEASNIRFFGVTAKGTVRESPQTFVEAMQRRWEELPRLTDRQSVSAELINDSFFPMPPEAQLVLRVAAIECLVEPLPRSDTFISHLARVLKFAESELPADGDRNAVLAWLRGAANEGIGTACRMKVRQVLGPERLPDFDRVYRARNRLVHAGKGRGEGHSEATASLALAADLLLRDIGVERA